MQKTILGSLVLAGLLATAAPAQAQEGFTGDTKLACEAILCLSTGQRPSACTPSLTRFFSISFKRFSDTLKGRTNFLKLCPTASQDSRMEALVNDIANGAGRCDAASLNMVQANWSGDSGSGSVSNSMPGYCSSYGSNSYTDGVVARYVGTPERGGFWVDPANFDQALRDYNARIANEDQQRSSYEPGSGG